MTIPLLENDLTEPGVIEPSGHFTPNGAPRRAVMCFFTEVVEKASGSIHARLGTQDRRPVYVTTWEGEQIAYFFPGIGLRRRARRWKKPS